MGGFLTTCKQRKPSYVTDNDSNINDDLTRRGFIPHGRVRHDTQLEALSSTDAILYKNPKTKQSIIRTKTLCSVSSKVTINTENRSESQSYYHRSQHDFDIEESGPEKFNTKLSTHYLSRIWTKKLSPYTKEVIELSDRSSSESSGYSLVFNKEDPPPVPSPDYDFDDQHENVISFNQQALHVKPTEDPPPEPSPDYDFDDQHKHVISFNQQVEVQVHEPLHMQYNKLKMEEVDISEKGRKEKEFQVITDINFLPRYTYHRSLLDWFMEDIPQDPMFQACHFTDCTILIGGNVTDETISKICGETTLREKLGVRNLRKEAVKHTHSLIVYFLRSNVTNEYREIEQIVNQLSFEGTFLFVMTSDIFDNEQMKSALKENVLELGNLNVEFVFDDRSEILSKMTRVLEQRLIVYLEQTKMKLRDYSRHHNVRLRLREVKAILRRLKQAACYPDPFKDEEEEEDPQEKEVEEILKSFGDKIIYKKYDGDTLYVITTDQDVKERLDIWYTKSGIKNINFETTVDAKLSISELTKSGVPLHGAKIVYVNEDVEAFKIDKAFATTGSLMMANGESMVIVTCRHALRNGHVYTLIDNAVVRLGQGIQQQQNNMNRLNEDIAVVQIDEETRSVITNKCEKLLIDECGYPTPAQISLSELRKDDIVHKRGANTGLTTGLVNSVENITVTGFNIPSPTILIQGKDGKPFAEKGDSGSLVFKHSYSVESNILDVIGMVQGKTLVPSSNPDIICFPFHEGRDFLITNNQDVDCLQFYNV